MAHPHNPSDSDDQPRPSSALHCAVIKSQLELKWLLNQ